MTSQASSCGILFVYKGKMLVKDVIYVDAKKEKRFKELTEELSDKQIEFCKCYVASPTNNGRQSAIDAGYGKAGAAVQASRLLTRANINEFIELWHEKSGMKAVEEAREKSKIADATEVLEYLTGVMRGTIKDRYGKDPTIMERSRAAELLGKKHRLFVERQEIDAQIKPIQIINDIPKDDE